MAKRETVSKTGRQLEVTKGKFVAKEANLTELARGAKVAKVAKKALV